MVKINIENTRIAIIGSTILTKKLINFLEKVNRPKVLMGLPSSQLKNKVNSVNIKDFCEEKKIEYIDDNSWNTFSLSCLKNNINLIIEFGDSRIIPSYITKRIFTIGNHGAKLPYIKGGASLVWGRMANLSKWGISLMKLDNSIDGGDIIATEDFNFELDIPMKDFIHLSDQVTMKCFESSLNKEIKVNKNPKSNIILKKHIDSFEAVNILRKSIKNNDLIYLPPRTPEDSKINNDWPSEFIEIFKIANNFPYPSFF